jgi:DNA-binding SARP family transcriptional activator/TolB-like protein
MMAPANRALTLSGDNAAAVAAKPLAAPVLRISVIGGANFKYGGREIPLRNRKGRAMLAYLALHEAGEEQRERLAGLFWSEFSEQNARTTLRQAVHELREVMLATGCNALVGTRTAVGLQPGSFRLDLDELMRAVAAHETPDTLLREERLAETLLAGYDDLDPSFHGWLMARRQTLHDRLMRSLEDGYRDMALPRLRRRRLAEAALLLDPTHEEACRVVMQCAAEDGEIGVALRAYDELYRLLGDEYDMEPSAATQALVAKVKQGDFDSVAGGDAPPPSDPPALSFEAEMRQARVAEHRTSPLPEPSSIPPKPALLVEKFAMSGIEPDQAHLVEGFRNELIACLARFREWYVTGTDGDYGDVPVSTCYAATTTAYKDGGSINVVMVLHERPSNVAIWGERFELRLDRWFGAQQHIVRRIAATLNVHLSAERLMRLSHVPDVSLEAYDIWLRGQAVINGYRVGEWNRIAQTLVRTIEREPGFSPLYSSLSQMNNVIHFVQPGKFRDENHTQRTLALAQRAVALDPRDSRAQLCLGWALAFCRRYSQAELHMEIACELNGHDSHTLMSSAMFHGFKGDTERAVKQAAMSMDMTLVPTLTHWGYLTNIRYLHGDYEGTIVAADRAQDGLLTMPAFRAAALCQLGRTAEARQDLTRFYANVRAAWTGDAPSTEAMVAKWLLHLYPISSAEIWERLRDGMALAGLPVRGLTYHGWAGD